MTIEHGSEVVDKNGKLLGKVDYIIRNTWTGEISKFMISKKAPARDIFISAEDVLEVTGSRIKLNISFSELSQDE